MNLNPLVARQIELLYLIYVHAGGVGDSTYSITLKDICTVDAGYKLWFIAAEDLKHEGWIELRGSQLDDAIASITPAGRKQAREWERQYKLDQRLVSIKPDGKEGQTGKARYWVNFTPIQSGPTYSSGDEVTLDKIKFGYVIFDGSVEDARHYVIRRTGGNPDIYVSNVEESERGVDIHLSSERQKEANARPPTDESRHIKWGDGWPTSDIEVLLTVGSIYVSRLNERRSQVTFSAWTADCAQYVDSLISIMRGEGVIVLPQIAAAAVSEQKALSIALPEGDKIEGLPFVHLSFNEACWAMDRTILECGFIENQDYISRRVGDTHVYTFYQDGWAYCRIVLSPVIDGGPWTWRHSLIWSSNPENDERRKAWIDEVLKLPYSQQLTYNKLPDFTDLCNEVWNLLYQEWREVATEKRNTVAKRDSHLLTSPILLGMSAKAGAGADGDNKNWGVLMSGLPSMTYPMGLKVQENQERGMTLETLQEIWPDVSNDRLKERLEIWKLWDKQVLMLKQIVAQVNPTESTIKRHLNALEAAGLLRRKRKKMNSK